jgi:putative membrane protein
MTTKIASSLALTGLFLHLTANPIWAHPGAPLAPHDLWQAWNWDLLLITSLALAAWRYGTGLADLWRRAGRGHGVTGWQASAFYAGLIALFVALISPLDALSGVLFSAHMVQHLLLIVVAAPLLAYGCPPAALWWALPQHSRQPVARFWRQQPGLRAIGHFLAWPSVAWLLHATALWVWHTPAFYQAAVLNPWIHHLEHVSFFGTALLFWAVLMPVGRHARIRYGIGVLMVFTTALYSGLLGALITFSTTLWYPVYSLTTAAWGITPLEDQQLAGLIMWVPANFVYLAAVLLLLGKWLGAFEPVTHPDVDRRRVAIPQTGEFIRTE